MRKGQGNKVDELLQALEVAVGMDLVSRVQALSPATPPPEEPTEKALYGKMDKARRDRDKAKKQLQTAAAELGRAELALAEAKGKHDRAVENDAEAVQVCADATQRFLEKCPNADLLPPNPEDEGGAAVGAAAAAAQTTSMDLEGPELAEEREQMEELRRQEEKFKAEIKAKRAEIGSAVQNKRARTAKHCEAAAGTAEQLGKEAAAAAGGQQRV